jgi:hypothetical protein
MRERRELAMVGEEKKVCHSRKRHGSMGYMYSTPKNIMLCLLVTSSTTLIPVLASENSLQVTWYLFTHFAYNKET